MIFDENVDDYDDNDKNDDLQVKMVADLQAGGSGVKPVKKSSIKEKVEKQIKLWGNKWKIHSNKLMKWRAKPWGKTLLQIKEIAGKTK